MIFHQPILLVDAAKGKGEDAYFPTKGLADQDDELLPLEPVERRVNHSSILAVRRAQSRQPLHGKFFVPPIEILSDFRHTMARVQHQ